MLGFVHVGGLTWFVSYYSLWLFVPGILLLLAGVLGLKRLEHFGWSFMLGCLLSIGLVGLHLRTVLLRPIEEDVIAFFCAEIFVLGYFVVHVLRSKLAHLQNVL